MCKRFQDCGFLGNKAVSNCIHTWPLWQWDVSAICKSNCNKIGVINVTLLLPPPTMPHVCVWLSLEVCQWTVRIWKWMIKELYCGLLTQSPLSVSQGLLFFSIIFIIMWNTCSCIGWTASVRLFEGMCPLPIHSSTWAGLNSCYKSLYLLQS